MTLRKNCHLTRNQEPEDVRIQKRAQGEEVEAQEIWMDPRWANPQGPTGDWSKAEDGKWGSNEHRKQRQLQACSAGAELSGGVWWVTGRDYVHVE